MLKLILLIFLLAVIVPLFLLSIAVTWFYFYQKKLLREKIRDIL